MTPIASCRAPLAVFPRPQAGARPEDEEALIRRVAAGDRDAFRLLVGLYAKKAYATAYRLLGSRSEAEDAVQEAFTKLWVHAAGWDADKGRFSTWFYRILTNSCIDSRRRKKPLPLDEEIQIADPAPGGEQQLMERQRSMQVRRAIAALPRRQRVALILCHYEEMSNRQAAEIMGLHVKALEGLLSRARVGLRRALAPLAQEEDGQ